MKKLALIFACSMTCFVMTANSQVSCFYHRIVRGNSVELHWCLRTDLDNYGSEAQRRGEAGGYVTLPGSFCAVPPLPPPLHECVFTDVDVPAGVWFYRIKTIDLDGTVRFSDSMRVVIENTRADYLIITPTAYLPIVQPLAAFRTARNGFVVRTITTEYIREQFGETSPPDSALKNFITHALTFWDDPKPQYFLLAGNVNTIPSHKERWLGFTPDSVLIDQWFVEGVRDTASSRPPAAAIGRFPAGNASQLSTMISKTIGYESQPDLSWIRKGIVVADRGFESYATQRTRTLLPLWSDTLSVHVTPSSPRYLTRRQFFDAVSQGCATMVMIGHANAFRFADGSYFTTWDVDSLANGLRLPLWIMEASHQGFDSGDTLTTMVNLLQTPGKGAVATFSSPDLVTLSGSSDVLNLLFQEIAAHPARQFGRNILSIKRQLRDGQRISNSRRWTLLGDPALTLKVSGITGVGSKPFTPTEYSLMQNYPNPFNPTTTIRYALPTPSKVSLKLYDMLGREVASLVDEEKEAGEYNVHFEMKDVASGVYFYRLHAIGTDKSVFVSTKKLALLR